jgi:aspartyl-tRNA(Asn)/glutamyl-tRNA(Gln) amidotransferase subunit A
MNRADIPFLSAAALGELIRKKDISPVEAATAYLDRIDAVDGKLHSSIPSPKCAHLKGLLS